VGLTTNVPLLDVTFVTESVLAPAFVTTTLSRELVVRGTFPNATDRLLIEKAVPVPLTVTVSLTVGAFDRNTMLAFWTPVTVGVNVILNADFEPAGIVPLAGLTT
jgi:hypothetical protein